MTEPKPEDAERHYHQDIFNRRVNAFIERYAPRSYDGRDFEHDLRGIIMDAWRIAQEPFVQEYKLYQTNILKASMLKP